MSVEGKRDAVAFSPVASSVLEACEMGADTIPVFACMFDGEHILAVHAVFGRALPVIHHLLCCIYGMTDGWQYFWRCPRVLHMCRCCGNSGCEFDKWGSQRLVELVNRGGVVVRYLVELRDAVHSRLAPIKFLNSSHSYRNVDGQEKRDDGANYLNPCSPFGLTKTWPIQDGGAVQRVHVHPLNVRGQA